MNRELSARPWVTEHMRALIGHEGPSCRVRMNAYNYADIRMFSRDVMDVVEGPMSPDGLIGYFEGTPIHIDKSVLKGVSHSFSEDGSEVAHMVVHEDGPTLLHSGPFHACPDERCIVHSVMGS